MQKKFDVAPYPLLFNEDGMMTHPDKSQLLKELETHLKQKDYEHRDQRNSSFIIDIMAMFARFVLLASPTFKTLSQFWYPFRMYTISLGDATICMTCAQMLPQRRTVRE